MYPLLIGPAQTGTKLEYVEGSIYWYIRSRTLSMYMDDIHPPTDWPEDIPTFRGGENYIINSTWYIVVAPVDY